ncbi:hypothetical protein J2S57_006853 [Kineosporia succinea]|uniref:ABC-type transport system involved in multi-copper enzyme maturation permease subunit n=1 Tax=Kineosporia succinea TaxID=84632 RepID=A0ABT9PFB9_9ACTN|nr:hypothetical protein [Kineosporia succinea]MDP9831104.1 hypothetical protein [Kineosporia succinea]
MRALRIELRRSVTAGLTLLLLAVGLFSLFGGGNSSNPAGWAALAYTLRDALVMMWPLAVGAGAWQARREQMAGLGELTGTSPRPPARRLVPVAVCLALGVVTAYLLSLLAGTVRLYLSPAEAYLTGPALVATAVGALSLVAATWLGLAAGALAPSRFTAPMVTVLALALTTLLPELSMLRGGPDAGLLLPGLHAPFQMDWVELPLVLSGKQAIWLAALAVTGYGLAVARRRGTKLLAAVPALATAVILVPTLPAANAMDAQGHYARDAEAMSPVCSDATGDTPRVCVMRVHSGLLPEVTDLGRRILETASVLPDAPTSAREVPAGEGTGDPRVVPISLYLDARGHLDDPDQMVAMSLADVASPTDCDVDLRDPADEGRSVAGDLATRWLTDRAGVEPNFVYYQETFDRAWAVFSALPAATQEERVAAFRAQGCDAGLDTLV